MRNSRELSGASNWNKKTSAASRLAHNLRRYRIASKLSQEELAARVGLSQTFLSQVECGSRNVSLDKIETLAEALQIDVIELLVAQIFISGE
jgi:transcriptional regulator with XRE-family HTH domain